MNMHDEIRLVSRRFAAFVIVLSAAVLPLCLCATELPERDWERIYLDGDHTSIEAVDKSRRNAAISTDTTGDLVVPSTLSGYKVVSIGKQAFYACSKLTSVTISEGVTNIADMAFYGCSSLTNVVFPSTLKSIGASAFIGCQKLQKVDVKVPRLTIGDRAFRDCDGLQTIQFAGDELIMATRVFFGCGGLSDVNLIVKDVTLSEGVFSGGYDDGSFRGYCDYLTNVLVSASNRVEFGESVFVGCSALQRVALTAGAEMNVGSTAFSGCTALRQATLTARSEMKVGASAFSSCWYNGSYYSSCDHLTNVLMVASNRVELGESILSDCTALQTVELPVGLVGVPTNAFSHCSALQSVALSSNVTSIAYRAFDTCTSMKTVELSEGLRTIEAQAFFGCESLSEMMIPQSVSSVGDRAFEACDSLGGIVFSGVDTNLYAAAEIGIGERCFYQDFSLSNVVFSVPSRIKAFGARTFSGCESLVRISLPTDLVEIAESMFESCSALVDVPLPVALKAIGNTAFNGCASLKDFLIPTNNVVTIGNKAFANTKFWNDWPDDALVENNGYIIGFKGNPTSVILPKNCKAIPNGMFEGMATLTNVVVPAGLETVGSWAFARSGICRIDFSKTKLVTLGVSAFEGCANLGACLLSDSLTVIPDDAFRNCASLLSVDLMSSVVSIGNSAFRDCAALSVVSGGDGVRTVGDYAFAGCVSLLPFRFPQDVAYGEHVFQSVRWTENVLFPSVGTMAQEYPQTYMDIKSVVISSTLTGIVDRACAGCASLGSISIPDGVRRVGESAFEGCTSLRSVVFPADFSNIGSNAFKGCTSVASLTVSGGFVLRDVFCEVYATIADVKIAEGVMSLCDSAFAGCSGLTELVMPTTLEGIGDYAFKDCTNLKFVKYMGPQPSANPNIYAGTLKDLWTKVRLENKASWTIEGGKTLPARWPVPESIEAGDYENARRIAFWLDAPKDDSGATITFYYYDTTGNVQKMSPEEGLGEIPDREGYEFAGWWTKPYGGVQVTEENYMELGVTKAYAHWVRNRDDYDDPQTWDDVVYNVAKSCTYDGYLLDGDAVVGTVQLKMAKGKYDRENACHNVSVTAKAFILGEGKNVSFKGVAEDVGEDGGSADLVCTKKSDERELSVTFTAKGLDGSLDGYDVVAARNLFAYSTEWDRRAALAAVDDCGGTHAVVLKADGDDPLSNGYMALSVNIGGKGKTKVSGMMPDGTKVSVSSQLLVLPDADEYVVPVVVPLYSGKKGGFGFGLRFSRDDEFGVVSNVTVFGVTEWVANPGRANEFTSALTEVGVGAAGNLAGPSSFAMEGSFETDAEILPDGTPVTPSGTKWSLPKADKVKFDRETESYEVLTDYGNPAGLKLAYTAKTGAFKGSFKVYAVTDAGKSKKYTATVTGAVIDGTGYGAAVIKNVGAVPVIIEAESVGDAVR